MSHVPGVEGLTRDVADKLLFGKSWPLPRSSKPSVVYEDKYEVVVSGAGPAGLFLTLNLSRLGLSDSSLFCFDSKIEHTPAGHADGINARTLEILRTLGLESDVLRYGADGGRVVAWRRPPGQPHKLEKEPTARINLSPTRFTWVKLFHQGRIERMFTKDLAENSRRGVQYGTTLIDVGLDESDPDYPVFAVIEHDGQQRTIRAKYFVGAEGAHSLTRQQMGIEREGNDYNRVWGVIDFVAVTDFPDIRMTVQFPGHLGEGRGHAFIVPRERLSNGDWVTRFYVDVTQYSDSQVPVDARKYKASITVDEIMKKVNEKIFPYTISIKEGTKPIWWGTYAFQQRVAKDTMVHDSHDTPRVFLTGDAVHTHSPSQGLGMNTGIQDSYNLSWKLAHAVLGLTPSPNTLLNTYKSERLPVGRQLVAFDREMNTTSKTEANLEERFRDMAEFGTGLVEYAPSLIVAQPDGDKDKVITSTDYFNGVIKPGRRLLNVTLTRFANDWPWDIQDDLTSDGRYRVLVLAASDFPAVQTSSRKAVEHVCEHTVSHFVKGLVEAIIVMPEESAKGFEWNCVSPVVKEHAEMRVYSAKVEDYNTYGVDPARGAVVVVRPDGVVGMVTSLEDIKDVDGFLAGVLRARDAVGEGNIEEKRLGNGT